FERIQIAILSIHIGYGRQANPRGCLGFSRLCGGPRAFLGTEFAIQQSAATSVISRYNFSFVCSITFGPTLLSFAHAFRTHKRLASSASGSSLPDNSCLRSARCVC